MLMEQKIGLIGVGNMGTAIVEGMLNKQLVTPSQVWIYDKLQKKASEFSDQKGVQKTASNEELIKQVNIILLAVKPQDLRETVQPFAKDLRKNHLIISVLAGVPIQKLRERLGPECQIVRAMPNLGAKVGEGVTALAGERETVLDLAKKIFSGCGQTVVLEEKYFDLVTALSGSGPAYFFLLMELMVREAVENGMSQEEAERLVVQTAVGASLLARSSSHSPCELRKMVTSKGGTTEAALQVLQDHQWEDIFRKAIRAARDRGRQLSQN